MTTNERDAIQKAIVAGIEAALTRVLVQPFPSGDMRSAIFHARSEIEGAVQSELESIEIAEDAPPAPRRDPYGNDL